MPSIASRAGVSLRAVGPAAALHGLDSLYRGLFDHRGRETYLADLAGLCGASGALIARRTRRGDIRVLAAWTAATVEDVMVPLTQEAQLWQRGAGAMPAVTLVSLGRVKAMRLLLDTKSMDLSVVALVWHDGTAARVREAAALLRTLARGAAKAVALRARLDDATVVAQTRATMLDSVPLALAIVDHAGDIVVANARARRLIEDHGAVAVRSRRLYARDGVDAQMLVAALDGATRKLHRERRPAVVQLSTMATVGRLTIHAVPLGASTVRKLPTDFEAPLALLSFEVAPPASPARLGQCDLYGLTPTERRTLEFLIAGQRPADIAHSLGVSLLTVRAHIRSLYDKTGRRGVPALISLFLGAS